MLWMAARLVVAAIITILVITVKSTTNSQIFSAQRYAIDKRPDHNLSYFCETTSPLMRQMQDMAGQA